MPKFLVTIPIAGHVTYEIEAGSKDDAIDIALEKNPDDSGDVAHIEYETLRTFNTGRVCHCPSPWEATADKIAGE